jgi:hypothetical protein
MNANLSEYVPRQSGDTTIVVVPSSLRYVEQMARCHQATYGYTPETASSEDMTAEKYARHLEIFPEGQFVALEVETDTVVGVTTSMRIDVDLQQPCLRSWAEITSDG